jgi:hypothetical protein
MSGEPRRSARWAVCAVAVAGLLGPAASDLFAADPQGVVVRRKVGGDQPIIPPRGGEGPSEQPGAPRCPGKVERAPLGAEIMVWLAPQMARRDEPSWSLILRLDEPRAYLLYHHDRMFSELRYPPGKKDLLGSFWQGVDEAELEKLAPAPPQPTPPTVTARRLGGQAVSEHRVTVIGSFGHRADYVAQVVAHPTLGEVGFRLEALTQAVWGQGKEWLSRAGLTEGIPVGLAIRSHGPDWKHWHREDFVALKEQAIPLERFVVPPGYQQVPYSADCLLLPH